MRQASEASPQRIQNLAARVRWLDKWRHAIALVVSIAVAVLLARRMQHALGDDFPRAYAKTVAVALGSAAWAMLELVCAGLAAMWETEHDLALRDRGLPRAVLVVSPAARAIRGLASPANACVLSPGAKRR